MFRPPESDGDGHSLGVEFWREIDRQFSLVLRTFTSMKFSVGDRVSILARSFDVPNEARWSVDHFGAQWKSARVIGTVLSTAGRNRWKVRWEIDGTESEHSSAAVMAVLQSSVDDFDQRDQSDASSMDDSDSDEDTSPVPNANPSVSPTTLPKSIPILTPATLPAAGDMDSVRIRRH